MANELEKYFSGIYDGNSRYETIVIINCVLNSPLMFISIIGNTLVLAAILKTPSLRSPSTILLCSLAVSDLLVGLVVQPNYIAAYLSKNISMRKAMTTMAFAACSVSLLTMTAIAVDRFLALHYHMLYPNIMTTSRAMYLSGTLWIVSFLLLFLVNRTLYLVTATVGIAICLLTCTVCYIRIYRIVRKHQLQIQVQQQAVASINNGNYLNMQKSKKCAKNSFIYFIVMILCYLPLIIPWSILIVSPNQWTIEWILADTIVFMNSSIISFLYCWRRRELREAVVKAAKRMLCKQTEEV